MMLGDSLSLSKKFTIKIQYSKLLLTLPVKITTIMKSVVLKPVSGNTSKTMLVHDLQIFILDLYVPKCLVCFVQVMKYFALISDRYILKSDEPFMNNVREFT